MNIPASSSRRRTASLLFGVAALLAAALAACGGGSSATAANGTTTSSGTSSSLAAGYKQAKWQSGVTVAFPNECTMVFTSTGAPSHGQAAYYLVPGSPVVATTPTGKLQLAVATLPVSTTKTSYSINICPEKSAATTSTGGGAIGWMISGAAMFNAYEGDMSTVAYADNVSYAFTDATGAKQTASFIDNCNGHQTPANAGAQYHYHNWSPCLSPAAGDTASGPSHLLGVANDGFPIYGDRDMNGRQIDVAQLDECNGITSATPEFPDGVYHYVLPTGAAMSTSKGAPRCYHGKVSASLMLAIARNGAFCTTQQTAVAQAADRRQGMPASPRG